MIRRSTSLVAVFLLAGVPAMADDDCAVAMADWQPRDAVERLAVANGWRVSRIRLDDGCYEVTVQDADGHWIEAKLDPGTLQIIEMEFDDLGHGGGSHERGDD